LRTLPVPLKGIPPKDVFATMGFRTSQESKKKHNLPGFTAFYGFFSPPKKKIWTWKAKCPIFKAIVVGFRGFQLPKKR